MTTHEMWFVTRSTGPARSGVPTIFSSTPSCFSRGRAPGRSTARSSRLASSSAPYKRKGRTPVLPFHGSRRVLPSAPPVIVGSVWPPSPVHTDSRRCHWHRSNTPRQPRVSSDPWHLVKREGCTGRDRCHWDRNSTSHFHRASTVLLIVGSASVDSVHTDWDHCRWRRSNRTRHLRVSNVRPAQRRPQATPTDTER